MKPNRQVVIPKLSFSRFTFRVLLSLVLAACSSQPAPTNPPIPQSSATPAPTNSPILQSSQTPTPITQPTLTICLASEPQTLYPFAQPEPNRQHILAALEDNVLIGPPNLRVETATVRTGDFVVDGLGRVQAATPGLVLTLLDGEVRVLEAGAEWQLPQMAVRFTLRPNLQWSDGAPLTAADFVFGFETAHATDAVDTHWLARERTATFRALSETELEWVGLPGFITHNYAQHLWPPLPRHKTLEEITASRAPLSYGPFRVQSWQAGESLTLERNPFYWRAAEGLPHLQSVIYLFGFANLAQCDVIPSGQTVNADVAALGLAAQQVAGARLDYAHFNVERELLKDLNMRQALSLCVQGDYATASRVLEAVGWLDSNSDGVREKDNQPLALSLAVGPNSAEAQTVAQNLQTCGVAVTVQTLTEGELLADWPDGVLFGRRFDVALFTWPLIDNRFPCEIWQTEQIASEANPAGVNVSAYSNAEFDAACRRLQTALDEATLAAQETIVQEILERDWPAVLVARAPLTSFIRPAVRGIELDASARSELWNLEEVVVEER